jgi:hypothetical protein
MSQKLYEPILESGIRNTHFFNGRLLAAEDLQAEQTARRQQQRQLGLAIGSGIVRGLEVTIVDDRLTNPILKISRGIAITPEGQTLALGRDVELAWASMPDEPQPQAGVFGDCELEAPNTVLTGAGIYILAVAPASGYDGRAPASGLGAEGRITGCGSRYEVEGVKFRAIKVVLGDIAGLDSATRTDLAALMSRTDPAGISLLRNRLAYLCFGADALAAAAASPLGRGAGPPPAARGGLLEAISAHGPVDAQTAAQRLTDCDVPLALVYWSRLDPNPNPAGIQFVDMWSVRRQPATAPAGNAWPLNLALGDPTAGAASLAQFAEHAAWLLGKLTSGERAAARAIDYLRYLPPAGLLPLAGGAAQPGFAYPQFFTAIPHRDNGPRPDETAPFITGVPYIEGAAVEALFRTATGYPPIDLVGGLVADSAKRTFIWLYQVRENHQAIDADAANSPQPCLILASGHLPEFGEARFSRAHWGYSNFM